MFAFGLTEDKKYYDFQNHPKPADFYIRDTEWEAISSDEACKMYVAKKLKKLFAE
jgi:hypothetical protein